MTKQLYKSTAIVSGMTLISRVMGFIRDMLIANIFGVSPATDAFFVAFKIPNFLRRLFAEGAFAHAFVPVLSDYKQNAAPAELKSFIDKTAGTLTVLLMVLTLVGVLATPLLIVFFAPGFLWQGSHYELAVSLLRITFPYLLFISLTAFAGSILNAHGRFAVPAITPVFLNICMIMAALWLAPLFDEPVLALAWGVFAAGVIQMLFQWPALARLGLLPRLAWGWRDSGVRRVLRLMLPAIFGVSVVQVNLLFDTLVASFLAAGSVSWLYYSDRLVEFPLGILGVAVSSVILPSLSNSHAEQDSFAFSRSLDWGLKLVMLIGLPATLGLVLLARPLLATLFQYNEFGADDVAMTSSSLMAFALGLLAFILIKVLVPGFTARQDAKTPVRFGLYSIVGNVLLNLVLVWPLAHAGVALATTLSAYLNAGLLLMALLKQKIYRPGRGWLLFMGRVIFGCLLMVGFLIRAAEGQTWLDWGVSQRSGHLLFEVMAAMLVYAAGLVLVGMRPRHLHEHSADS
ncbi:murein biosynthesis integral membrane protein MurJ [Methylomonas sp. SURF-2]|uniref:Probable lipid II flippase MurJ n=1 Tax=Methylomonas subterranea TaxID=2952225 RepID=A0ABT1TBS7_9GAMM|nr:murein biosynthesis integral membrane protein MurJ [Methylomonas sp. SURF-2]MCQ8102759.1 murein biosynthesis integral membrane protein MurJ [Methylomonas sp. SURF-2]